jgi:hypothetical protein
MPICRNPTASLLDVSTLNASTVHQPARRAKRGYLFLSQQIPNQTVNPSISGLVSRNCWLLVCFHGNDVHGGAIHHTQPSTPFPPGSRCSRNPRTSKGVVMMILNHHPVIITIIVTAVLAVKMVW